ncbi:MAG: hypothetical protein KDD61_13255 [Bdellovibrionales bacterium]|nr:hypothetical protein [Bdellovibrionales bacterium]
MQTKKWSSDALRKDFSGCIDLGEVIKRLEADLLIEGEVICGIRVNGMFLTQEDELKFSDSLMADISELEISSQRPEDLVSNSIASVVEWIPKVRDYSIEVADIFRGEQQLEAQKSFRDIMDGCRWLTDALSLLKGPLLKRTDRLDFDQKWSSLEKSLIQIVAEISDAYENQDFIHLADLLEYELSNAMEAWQDLLSPTPSL